MSKAKGYSIWLRPATPEFEIVHKIISDLSTKYNSPKFDPHITLLASVEKPEHVMSDCVKILAQEFQQFKVKFRGYEMLDTFFMSLFFPTDLTPTLNSCHIRAKELCQWTLPPTYYPHLSLIYAELSNAEKLDIIETLGAKFGGLEITIDRIQLYSTVGTVADWNIIEDLFL